MQIMFRVPFMGGLLYVRLIYLEFVMQRKYEHNILKYAKQSQTAVKGRKIGYYRENDFI